MIKMMFTMSLLVLGMMHIACSTVESKDPRDFLGVHPELQVYMDMYVHSKGSGLSKSISMDFGDTGNKNYLAVCSRWVKSNVGQIVVDKKEWDIATEDKKRHIIYHEMGHCDLELEHNNHQFIGQLPSSVMHTSYFKIPTGQWSKYVKELFYNNNK